MRNFLPVALWAVAMIGAMVGVMALGVRPAAAGGGALAVDLVEDGVSQCVIVVSKEASPSEKWAAEDLADHLKQITGAAVRVLTEGDAEAGAAKSTIIIGDGPAARAAGVNVDAAQLGPEGYVVKTLADKLIIAGGRQRGTMYGVYDFLAQLGCRWWTPGVSTIPHFKTLPVSWNVTKIPALEYRAALYGDSSEPGYHLWMARNHLNGEWFGNLLPEKYGGSYTFDSLAHTFTKLVPPDKFFAAHPEYYALRNGKRVTDQLCLSNTELVPVVADALLAIANKHPEYQHVTFGQDDNHNYCQCEKCQALYAKYGAPSGAMLEFTNKVAAIVKEKHPKLWVNTMAYEWSRKPPTGIVPADNVMVTFCSIECDFGRPFVESTDPVDADFVKDADGWAKIAPKVFVWDYTTNFVAYLAPYPNYYSLQPNVKFYADHKVRGLFEQGSHTTNNGQFSKLCLWVEAQAMWNPEGDGKQWVEDFMAGYYGEKAGGLIWQYLNLLHDKVVKDKLPAYATHRSFYSAPYLTPEIIARGEQLFEQAEAAVKGEPELLKRVRIAHVPVQLVILKRPTDLWAPVKKACPELTWAKLGAQFSAAVKAGGIDAIAEGDGINGKTATGAPTGFLPWVADYAALREKGDGGELPAEVRALPAGSYRFLHAAQLDQESHFLRKVPGACDGWAQNVVTYGWAIQHHLAEGVDYQPGNNYQACVRFQGKLKPEAKDAKGAGVQFGWYSKAKSVSIKVPVEQLDGQWHVATVAWPKPPPGGVSFYACLDQANQKNVTDVYFDSIWWVAVEAGK